jgi:hypothetical protein
LAAPLKIIKAEEPWCEYLLEDGTTVRFRFTACSFIPMGVNPADGNPQYQFSNSLLIEVHPKRAAARAQTSGLKRAKILK